MAIAGLLRFPLTLISMALGVAVFRSGAAIRFLPAQVKHFSPGFIAVAALYMAAGVLRHILVGGAPWGPMVVTLSVYLTLLIAVFGVRAGHLTLVLCASIGVDLIVSFLNALDIGGLRGGDARVMVLAWEFAAAGWAVWRYSSSRGGVVA